MDSCKKRIYRTNARVRININTLTSPHLGLICSYLKRMYLMILKGSKSSSSSSSSFFTPVKKAYKHHTTRFCCRGKHKVPCQEFISMSKRSRTEVEEEAVTGNSEVETWPELSCCLLLVLDLTIESVSVSHRSSSVHT